MDPDQALAEIIEKIDLFRRDLAKGWIEAALEAAEHFILAFEDLNDWLSKGGFDPAAWNVRLGEMSDEMRLAVTRHALDRLEAEGL